MHKVSFQYTILLQQLCIQKLLTTRSAYSKTNRQQG